ncbi:MAG: F0F1 ATP synthase subunit A [Caldilineaceae bacterium]|nr:F0F1 ATP synthase subunit A [Caldilineaceae bacterium]
MSFITANPRRTMLIGGVLVLIIISFFISVPQPHVSLAAEALFEDGPSWLTNALFTTFIIDIILILLAVSATSKMNVVPRGLQNLMEAAIEYLYGLAESVAGRAAGTYFPWVATIFLFVVVSNWSGLIPGVGSIGFFHTGGQATEEQQEEGGESHGFRFDQQLAMVNGGPVLVQAADAAAAATTAEAGEKGRFVPLFRAPSADLNVTFALAIATMVMVQIHGIRALGAGYFRKFWNTSGEGFMKGINIFVGILELISEFSRIIAFGFRLFGNIFAGEIVLATMAFLVAFVVPLPFYLLEILVGAVQALVFMMLALVFFTMATISHAHGDEHH